MIVNSAGKENSIRPFWKAETSYAIRMDAQEFFKSRSRGKLEVYECITPKIVSCRHYQCLEKFSKFI